MYCFHSEVTLLSYRDFCPTAHVVQLNYEITLKRGVNLEMVVFYVTIFSTVMLMILCYCE